MVTTPNKHIAQFFAQAADRGVTFTGSMMIESTYPKMGRLWRALQDGKFVCHVLLIDEGEAGYRLFVENNGVSHQDGIDAIVGPMEH